MSMASNYDDSSPIDFSSDTLNDPFERALSLNEVTELYLRQADLFYVDQTSGGTRERVEQFIKFVVTLTSPPQ